MVATPVRDWAAMRLVLATHPATELAPKELVNAIECGASPRAGKLCWVWPRRIGLSGRSLPHWHGGSATGGSSSLAAPIVAHVRILAGGGDIDPVIDDLVRSVPREHAA